MLQKHRKPIEEASREARLMSLGLREESVGSSPALATETLPYSVTVARQILVLSVLVRIQVGHLTFRMVESVYTLVMANTNPKELTA